MLTVVLIEAETAITRESVIPYLPVLTVVLTWAETEITRESVIPYLPVLTVVLIEAETEISRVCHTVLVCVDCGND